MSARAGVVCRVVLALASVALAAGCGESDRLPAALEPEPVNPISDQGSVVTIRVLGAPGDQTPVPIAGAIVRLDAPGGARLHTSTGADGRARFTGLDFEQGPAAATAHVSGYPLASRTGITPPLSEVVLTLYGHTSQLLDQSARIHGTVVGAAKPNTTLEVSATTSRDRSVHRGPDWALHVPAGRPLLITAVERGPGDDTVSPRGLARHTFGWAVAAHDAVRSDTVVDLELGRRVAPARTHGWFALPANSHGALATRGRPEVTVLSGAPVGALLGLTTFIDVDCEAPGQVDYEVEWIAPPEVTTPITVFSLSEPDLQWQRSWVVRRGYPTPGAQNVEFLDAPVVTGAGDAPRPLHEPLAWRALAAGVAVRLVIMRGWEPIWVVDAAPGSASLQVPRAPISLGEAKFVGAGPLGAVLQARTAPDRRGTSRGAQSELFALAP